MLDNHGFTPTPFDHFKFQRTLGSWRSWNGQAPAREPEAETEKQRGYPGWNNSYSSLPKVNDRPATLAEIEASIRESDMEFDHDSEAL